VEEAFEEGQGSCRAVEPVMMMMMMMMMVVVCMTPCAIAPRKQQGPNSNSSLAYVTILYTGPSCAQCWHQIFLNSAE
jgi:hypothetical protein